MENKIKVKFKKLNPNAITPSYAHEGDVGMDLTAIGVEYDEKNDMYVYHTGLAFASDFNIGQLLFVRSSNRKTDAYLCNHVGIADSAIYRGEIMLCFKNRTSLKERIFTQSTEKFFEVLKTTNSIKMALEEQEKENIRLKSINPLEYAPYKTGDRVGQMVFIHYPTVELEENSELNETERGSGGFGSTGN